MIEAVAGLLRFSAPVAFAALGESVTQKSGVINIGIEGMMLSAAFFSVIATEVTGNPWLGLLAGVFAAVVLCLIQSLFVLKWAADQVVVGTAINLLSLGLTSSLYRMRYGASGSLISVAGFPRFGPWDLVILALPFVAVGIWYVFTRTRWGLACRACGEYPDSVHASGFSVLRVRLQASLIGAALAGVGGSFLALGISPSFAENMTSGRGFIALAMVTFGRWNPLLVLGASLLIGFFEQLQFRLQAQQVAVPYEFLTALPYVAALVVLVVVGRGTSVPHALARPYRKEGRA